MNISRLNKLGAPPEFVKYCSDKTKKEAWLQCNDPHLAMLLATFLPRKHPESKLRKTVLGFTEVVGNHISLSQKCVLEKIKSFKVVPKAFKLKLYKEQLDVLGASANHKISFLVALIVMDAIYPRSRVNENSGDVKSLEGMAYAFFRTLEILRIEKKGGSADKKTKLIEIIRNIWS